MTSKLDKLISCIGKKNLLQKNYVNKSIQNLSANEISDLRALISFYISEGYSIDYIAESYLTFVQDSLKEQYFFLKNHYQYRYSKFEQVAEDVYFNSDYMEKYMIGLGISQYIWPNHIGLRRWFEQMVIHAQKPKKKNTYLEIGPGHGNYFTKAVYSSKYKECIAIDISETSVKLTKSLLEFSDKGSYNCKYNVICQDFFNLSKDCIYDTIVMGEVLEHVEEPRVFLNKIHKLSDPDTFIFISTVVNAPAKDHIYLFQNKEEIFSMCREERFSVQQYACFTANEISLCEAEEERQPIIVGLILKKES